MVLLVQYDTARASVPLAGVSMARERRDDYVAVE